MIHAVVTCVVVLYNLGEGGGKEGKGDGWDGNERLGDGDEDAHLHPHPRDKWLETR